MKHLAHSQCIALMLDLLDKKERKNAEDHLKACKECGKKYKALLPIANPYFRNKVIFPEMLKKRILISAAQLRNSTKKAKLSDKIWLVREKVILYASITASIFVLASGIAVYLNSKSSSAYFKISSIYGKAEIDAVPARLYDTVSSGNTISTNDNSAIMLLTLRDNKMMIMGKSQLTINNAKLNRNNNLEVNYSLDKGILLNKSNHNTSIKNAYTTPHALIRAQDADLLLQTSNDASSIFLIKGKLEVLDKNSSNKIIIDSPGKYTITNDDGMKMTKTTDTAISDIQKLNEVFNMDDNESSTSRNCTYLNQNPDDAIKNQNNVPNDDARLLYEKLSQHINQDTEQQNSDND